MKKASLFKNGGSQAVRLSKEFQFQGDIVYIKQLGNAVVLMPEVFMANRDQPELEDRESLFQQDGNTIYNREEWA